MLFELVASQSQPVVNITVTRRQNALALFQAYAEKALAAGASPKGLEQAFAATLQISPSMWRDQVLAPHRRQARTTDRVGMRPARGMARRDAQGRIALGRRDRVSRTRAVSMAIEQQRRTQGTARAPEGSGREVPLNKRRHKRQEE